MGNCFSYLSVEALHASCNVLLSFIEDSSKAVVTPAHNIDLTRNDQMDLFANESREKEEESDAKEGRDLSSSPKKIGRNDDGSTRNDQNDSFEDECTEVEESGAKEGWGKVSSHPKKKSKIEKIQRCRNSQEQTLFDIAYTVYLHWQREHDRIWLQKVTKLIQERSKLVAFFEERDMFRDVVLDFYVPLEKMRKPTLLKMEEYHRYCVIYRELRAFNKEYVDMKKTNRNEMYEFLGVGEGW